jgi:hypothetical protein
MTGSLGVKVTIDLDTLPPSPEFTPLVVDFQ